MSGILAAPFMASAALLVAAGMPKLRDPLPLVRALRSAGLPAGPTLVRVIAGAETALGVWAVTAPGRLSAALVCAAYLLFTAFVALTLKRGGVLGSCGCFGKPDTPPTGTHLSLTGLTALLAAAVSAEPSTAAWTTSTSMAVGTLALAGLIAFLAWQALAVLPTTTPTAVRSTGKG